MEWRRSLVPVLFTLGLAFGAVACGEGDDQSRVTATEGAQLSPTSVGTRTPPSGSRTDIPEVDAILDAIESGEPDRIGSLLRFTPSPCVSPASTGGLVVCRPDQAVGTPVDILPVSVCEETFMTRQVIDPYLETLAEVFLHGVYKAPPGIEPPAQYVAVFSKSPQERWPGLAVAIDQGQIVKFFFAMPIPDSNFCAQTSEEIVEGLGLKEIVLPPVEP